jgi:hypothetical protein
MLALFQDSASFEDFGFNSGVGFISGYVHGYVQDMFRISGYVHGFK